MGIERRIGGGGGESFDLTADHTFTGDIEFSGVTVFSTGTTSGGDLTGYTDSNLVFKGSGDHYICNDSVGGKPRIHFGAHGGTDGAVGISRLDNGGAFLHVYDGTNKIVQFAGSDKAYIKQDLRISVDGKKLLFGSGYPGDASIQYDGSNLLIDTEELTTSGGKGNLGINTATLDGTATGCIAIGNGTPPGGGTANQSYIYAKDDTDVSEMFVMDEDGNETKISPHDPVTGDWVFWSQNKRTGRRIEVNMERVVKLVEELSGEKLLFEELIS